MPLYKNVKSDRRRGLWDSTVLTTTTSLQGIISWAICVCVYVSISGFLFWQFNQFKEDADRWRYAE